MPTIEPQPLDYPEKSRLEPWRLAVVVLAAAVAGALILITVRQVYQLPLFFRQLSQALIYSVSIGPLSAYSLRPASRLEIAHRRGFKLATPVVVLLMTNTVGCLIAGLAQILLGLSKPGDYWSDFSTSVGLGAIITLTFGLSMYFYHVQQAKLEQARLELRARQVEEERARKLAAEVRLSSLESRIHPHFLFNTLNSIASLIPRDPKRAEDMVTKLASLLRFSLNANQARLVPLSQEIAVMRNYLEIEEARFGPRLRYSVDIPASLENFGVPPLSLQSLVENSVKHAIANRPEGGEIHVGATVLDGCVQFDVSDTGPGFALETIPPGHGIHNLSDRLALLYGPEASLEVTRNGLHAAVRVTLPHRS